ncbi:NCAM [Mytilus coruscus]|uniref:NCAM n=1 Tax=Mytilus coruscus TaxID=42192 RepID=A0A6J8EMC9_MYTCO|nr:NCAM [Mytilus coruscus]
MRLKLRRYCGITNVCIFFNFNCVEMLMMYWFLIIAKTGVLNSDNNDIYLRPGDNTTLKCPHSTGDVQWLFTAKIAKNTPPIVTVSENKIISPSFEFRENFNITRESEKYYLIINNATKHLEGTYRCCSNNSSEKSDKFELRLKEAPFNVTVMNTINGTVQGKENENLTLGCYTLGGIPRGRTIWYHEKENLTMIEDDNEWANFSIIARKEHNGSIYTCVVQHDMLTSPLNRSVNLDILYSPRIQSLMWPHGLIALGQHVNITCISVSNPSKVEIQWTKDDQSVDSNRTVEYVFEEETNRPSNQSDRILMQAFQSVVSTITIEKVMKTDAGAYTCNVTNSIGTTNETILLFVQDTDRSEKTTTEISPILIYLVVCCCAVLIFCTSAQMYSCFKSGKLQKIFGQRIVVEIIAPGEAVNLQNLDPTEDLLEMETNHYMEIEF